VARSRLYVAGSGSATIIARRRPWPAGRRTVRRRHFATLIESASGEPGRQQAWSPVDAAVVFLPPLIAFSLVALVGGQRLIAFGAGCAVFFLMA
jgi:hypothetical protein